MTLDLPQGSDKGHETVAYHAACSPRQHGRADQNLPKDFAQTKAGFYRGSHALPTVHLLLRLCGTYKPECAACTISKQLKDRNGFLTRGAHTLT